MSSMLPIIKKDLKEILHSKVIYFSFVLPAFLLAIWGQNTGTDISHLTGKGLPLDRIIGNVHSTVSLNVFMYALLLSYTFALHISGSTITIEKAKHLLESLLCTPAKAKEIWLGKTIAVFLPSVILGIACTFLGLAGINQFVIVPKLGIPIGPNLVPVLTALIVVPAIIFFFLLLTIGVELTVKNAQWVTLILFGLIFAMSFGALWIVHFDVNSWDSFFIFLGIAVVLAMSSAFLGRFITPERIVLSSKG